MSNERSSPIDRRRLLRLGTLVGVLVAGGCGGGDEVQTVTTPPVKGGNRAFLDNSKKDAAAGNDYRGTGNDYQETLMDKVCRFFTSIA